MKRDMSRNRKVSEMEMMNAELDKVALTRRRKEVAFDAAVRSSEGESSRCRAENARIVSGAFGIGLGLSVLQTVFLAVLQLRGDWFSVAELRVDSLPVLSNFRDFFDCINRVVIDFRNDDISGNARYFSRHV